MVGYSQDSYCVIFKTVIFFVTKRVRVLFIVLCFSYSLLQEMKSKLELMKKSIYTACCCFMR